MRDTRHENTRFSNPPTRPDGAIADEVLVTDTPAGQTPAQMVERKLVALLQDAPMPLSMRHTGTPRRALS